MITNFRPYDYANQLTPKPWSLGGNAIPTTAEEANYNLQRMQDEGMARKRGNEGGFARFQRDPRPMTEEGLLDIERARGSGIPTMYGQIMQRRRGSPPGVAGALGKSTQAGTSPALTQFQDAAIDDFYYGPAQNPFDLLRRGGY